MNTLGTACLVLAISAMPFPALAQVMKHSETAGEPHHDGMSAGEMCGEPVMLSEAAEKKLGGSLYTGPLPESVSKMSEMSREHGVMQSEDVSDQEMSSTKAVLAGTHNVHAGLRGGEFIMVPDNLRHMEVVYSLECGFQLFLYNAFTEPISVAPFQAMILVLPEDGDEFFELMRFLVPSEDGGVLQTKLSQSDDDPENSKGIMEVELYIKFPESLHLHKFDLFVGVEDD